MNHYYNPNIETGAQSLVLDANNPTVGFSKTSISISDDVLTCRVTRKNSMAHIDNYFDVSNTTYNILFAYGHNDEESKFAIKLTLQLFLSEIIFTF